MHVNHVNIVVSDLERSRAFYEGLLGMRVTFEVELTGAWIEKVSGLPGVTARCLFCQPSGGGTRFELLEYVNPPGVHLPEDSRANTLGLRHVALEVDDIAAWHTRLATAGIDFISEPVWVPFSVVGGIRKRLCYFYDPDGVLIELAEFAPEEHAAPERV